MPENKIPETEVAASTAADSTGTRDDSHENLWIRLMTALHWYPRDMPSIEKRLVLKLDLMILIYGCLMFFTKYLDQA